MKWIYRFFTVSMLAAVLIGPFLMDNKNGKPMMSLPNFSDFNPASLIPGNSDASDSSAILDALPSSKTTVFKWQDKEGNWHYGDQAPGDKTKVSTVEVDSNTNIIQSLKLENDEDENNKGDSSQSFHAQHNMTAPPGEGEDFLTIERTMNILNDAQSVQGVMDSRNDRLKSALGE